MAASAVASARSIRSIARPRRASHRFEGEIRRVLDVSEIDLRFDRRHGIEQARANRLALAAERPTGDALGLSPLRLRLRLDQIGKPLHLGKIDLAVDERAPGEFPGLGETQSGNERQRLDDRRRDGAPASDADFRHLLAGEAARRAKPGDQGPVERLVGVRVAQSSQDGAAVGKLRPRRDCLERLRTASGRTCARPRSRLCRRPDAGAKIVS